MPPKKKAKSGHEGDSPSQDASPIDIDDLLIELAAMRSRQDTLEKEHGGGDAAASGCHRRAHSSQGSHSADETT